MIPWFLPGCLDLLRSLLTQEPDPAVFVAAEQAHSLLQLAVVLGDRRHFG